MRNVLHAGSGGWWVVVGISSHEECVTCGVGWVVGGSGYILS